MVGPILAGEKVVSGSEWPWPSEPDRPPTPAPPGHHEPPSPSGTADDAPQKQTFVQQLSALSFLLNDKTTIQKYRKQKCIFSD